MKTKLPTKSAGHICFTSALAAEFFAVESEVFRAPPYAPLADAGDTRRHGRWESSREHFARNQAFIVW